MDIVERLRDGSSMYDADDVDLHLDAADEIERLRSIVKAYAREIERLREENKRLRELNQHKTMQGRLDGRTVILHQSGDVWVPHWQEDPEVQGGE